ncbi:uncharacterized protein LOC135468241 isoform X2 [Liolophura sinensis]|uniref:uncharacterized protein LOC135468241 isoform X2 n=1 Tax=Liolophura sinensis TaxID=3198878 RepID=UPI0031580317
MGILRVCFLAAMCAGVVMCCQPPDCDREDCGTCEASTLDVYNLMVDNLKKGGADSRYTYKGGQDLRPYNTTADFVLQAWHTTLKNHYNDTLDFTVLPSSTGFTSVTAFSISQIAGAYCDAGQNYKNLVGYVKGLNTPYQMIVSRGCPPPTSRR